MKQLLFSIAVLIAAYPFSVGAQDMPVDPIVEQLLPERTGPVISNAPPELTRGIQRKQPIPQMFDLPKVQLVVAFEGETHRLTEQGMRAVRSIASAFSDPRLAGASFQIGSHAYLPNNLGTSQILTTRRATALAEHLHVFYGIPKERMVAVGYGATSPFDLAQPSHPMNQRVELINLSPLDQ